MDHTIYSNNIFHQKGSLGSEKTAVLKGQLKSNKVTPRHVDKHRRGPRVKSNGRQAGVATHQIEAVEAGRARGVRALVKVCNKRRIV